MGKVIVTYNEVIELNQILQEKNIKFKVHLHDTCGNQGFSVELLSCCAEDEALNNMSQEITEYFKNKGIQIKFSTDKLGFYVI